MNMFNISFLPIEISTVGVLFFFSPLLLLWLVLWWNYAPLWAAEAVKEPLPAADGRKDLGNMDGVFAGGKEVMSLVTTGFFRCQLGLGDEIGSSCLIGGQVFSLSGSNRTFHFSRVTQCASFPLFPSWPAKPLLTFYLCAEPATTFCNISLPCVLLAEEIY